MLRIEEFKPQHIEQTKKIHERFYKEEFSFPDFYNQFLCAFVIEDDDGQIITAGGVRTIAEAVIVTDKDIAVHKRIRALKQVLGICSYVSGNFNYNQLHAFIQDPIWEQFLKDAGFATCKGNALYYNVGNN